LLADDVAQCPDLAYKGLGMVIEELMDDGILFWVEGFKAGCPAFFIKDKEVI
jgi:hypothetical protein